MDYDAIADRRRMRRKLGFWRAAALVTLVLAVAALAYVSDLLPADGRGGPQIARIEVSGLITADQNLLKRLEDLRENDDVEAVIVAIESPGGTTYGGERLYDAIRAIAQTKPVAAEVRGLAASAGYMVAIATDHIVAGQASIVGSIGVIFQYGNVSELLDRIGVSVDAVKSAPLKAEPSPFEETSGEAEEMIARLVMDSYDWFVAMVAERRDFSREKALRLSDGSIFTGRQALDNGLVDALGAEAEIRSYFVSRGIDEDLRIVEWQPRGEGGPFFLKALAGAFGGWVGDVAAIPEIFEGLTDRKLFLDGLVSVWQVDG